MTVEENAVDWRSRALSAEASNKRLVQERDEWKHEAQCNASKLEHEMNLRAQKTKMKEEIERLEDLVNRHRKGWTKKAAQWKELEALRDDALFALSKTFEALRQLVELVDWACKNNDTIQSESIVMDEARKVLADPSCKLAHEELVKVQAVVKASRQLMHPLRSANVDEEDEADARATIVGFRELLGQEQCIQCLGAGGKEGHGDVWAVCAECKGAGWMKLRSLHVYSNDCEWEVARSKDDAAILCTEATGYVRDENEPTDEERWEELPSDGTTKMWCDADGKPGEIGEGTLVEMTNREWCEKHGRGYLGTTEG